MNQGRPLVQATTLVVAALLLGLTAANAPVTGTSVGSKGLVRPGTDERTSRIEAKVAYIAIFRVLPK